MLKQLFHIRNEQGWKPSENILSIRVGPRHCAYAIADLQGSELRELGYYSIEGIQANPVAELFASQPSLEEPFFKVLAAYDYPESTLVPASRYNGDDAGMALETLFGLNGNAVIIADHIKEQDLYNVYAVPLEMHQWMNRKFKSGNYWHQYTIGLKSAREEVAGERLLVDLRPHDFSVMAIQGKKLLLAQTFDYSTPEDILYYLLKICQQFGFSQQTVNLELSGLLEKESPLYKELYQYFIPVSFRLPAWSMPENGFPPHFFTAINDLARCAS